MKYLNRVALLVMAAFCFIGCEKTKLQMDLIGTWTVLESTDKSDIEKVWRFNADKTCIVNGWMQLSEVRGEKYEYAIVETEQQTGIQIFQKALDENGQEVFPKNDLYIVDRYNKSSITLRHESKTLTLVKVEK
ncbi:MAG: hypothetical protein MSS82_07370 [Bacteroidales bacterium]|nr:hypothetical protein [Bacteroidales bacterium]